jgi:pimeloyl-ACP methyl ester carboxylesterase
VTLPSPPGPAPTATGRGAAPWPAPEQITADGRRIALRRVGTPSATPAFLVHGLDETSEAWRGVAAHLPAQLPLLAADLPGFGGSEARGSYAISAVAATLAAVALEEVDGPVDLVGHGWGATIAIALAAARPALVRRLVVIGGGWPPGLAAGPSQPAPELKRSRLLAESAGPAASNGVRRAYLAADPALTGAPRPQRSRVIWGAQAARTKGLRPRYGEKVVTALGSCVDPATVDMITFPEQGGAPHRAAPAAVAAQLCEFLLAP